MEEEKKQIEDIEIERLFNHFKIKNEDNIIYDDLSLNEKNLFNEIDLLLVNSGFESHKRILQLLSSKYNVLLNNDNKLNEINRNI